jgi:RNA polymerase sigma-70 factor (ECF subfamily)
VTDTQIDLPRFEALFRTHVQFVARALRRCGVGDADLDDAVQEVFMTVAAKIDQYEERGALRAWLFTIARQTAQHARRSTARRIARESTQEPNQAELATPEDEARYRQGADRVREFLSGLPEEQAAAFYLSEIEGLSAPEIAACDGTNLNTVYARIRIARERFGEFVRRLHREGRST